MLFERYPRYEEYTISGRKIAAFLRKQAKERDRYPLFSEHVAGEQHSADEEMTKRVKHRMKSIQDSRNFRAYQWRKCRAFYFQQPEHIKDVIRAKWQTWRGPRTPTYFSWMVDVESGEQARRLAAIEEQFRPMRERIQREVAAINASIF